MHSIETIFFQLRFLYMSICLTFCVGIFTTSYTVKPSSVLYDLHWYSWTMHCIMYGYRSKTRYTYVRSAYKWWCVAHTREFSEHVLELYVDCVIFIATDTGSLTLEINANFLFVSGGARVDKAVALLRQLSEEWTINTEKGVYFWLNKVSYIVFWW